MRRRLAESTSSFPKETEEDLPICSAECPKKRALYGTRDAAQIGSASWEDSWRKLACTEKQQAHVCTPKKHEESVLRYTVMMSLARPPGKPQWLLQKFTERYEIKTEMIRDAADHNKQLQIGTMGVPQWLWIEADPRHVKEVIRTLGLDAASPIPTQGEAPKGQTKAEGNEGSIDPSWPPCSVRSRRG